MIFHELAKRGWTYEQIGGLTFAQARNELNGGRPPAKRRALTKGRVAGLLDDVRSGRLRWREIGTKGDGGGEPR